jgi:hypothetical protein
MNAICGLRRSETSIGLRARLLGTIVVLLSLIPASALAQTAQQSGFFVISGLMVSYANNMHFRVIGMAPVSACGAGTNWAYVDEADSGAEGKIATLLAAYLAGKQVNLVILPTNYYANGQMFCHITEIAGVTG